MKSKIWLSSPDMGQNELRLREWGIRNQLDSATWALM